MGTWRNKENIYPDICLVKSYLYHMGHIKQKSALEHQQNAMIQIFLHMHKVPASVAQLDARPTEDQEVGGSTPAGSATFFCGD